MPIDHFSIIEIKNISNEDNEDALYLWEASSRQGGGLGCAWPNLIFEAVSKHLTSLATNSGVLQNLSSEARPNIFWKNLIVSPELCQVKLIQTVSSSSVSHKISFSIFGFNTLSVCALCLNLEAATMPHPVLFEEDDLF